MSAFLSRIKNALRLTPKVISISAYEESKATLLTAYETTRMGVAPKISFADMLALYHKDYAVKAVVDFWADQVVGMGFYTTVNAQYPQAEKVKTLIDDFCEEVNLDNLLQVTAREVVGCGNSFWEKIEPETLQHVKLIPLISIDKINADKFGKIENYMQSATYGGTSLEPERVIHYKWNPVAGELFGTGVIRCLLETLPTDSEDRPALSQMKAKTERLMVEILERYSEPDTLWTFEGMSDASLKLARKEVKTRPRVRASFVYNKPADVKTVALDPRARFEYYIDHIVNQYYLGLQSPLPKLFTTPGFTEASAKAAIEIAERKIMAIQRFIKRIVEREVFNPIIQQHKYDVKLAECRLNWGIPEIPETKIEDALNAVNFGIITREEARAVLKKAGWELTEEIKRVTGLKEAFSWLRRIPDESRNLIYGVAICEGVTKHKHLYTREELTRAARTLIGKPITIDHWDEDVNFHLPKEYVEEYGIKTPYPVGVVLHAEEEEARVEWIGTCENEAVYNLIKAGKIKGSSTYAIAPDVEHVNGIKPIGVVFKDVSLLLKASPASEGTWVKPLDRFKLGWVNAQDLVLSSQIVKNSLFKKEGEKRK